MSEFFWRNRPLRVRDVVQKIRINGIGWLFRRMTRELRTPETTEGVYLRQLMVAAYTILLAALSPLIVLARVALRLPRKTLYYFYDLDVSPITFDIADALVLAELERRRRGLDSLYAVIVPGRHGGLRDEGSEYENVVDRASRWWRLHHLLIPMLSLLPS